jgi:hypothetical protein
VQWNTFKHFFAASVAPAMPAKIPAVRYPFAKEWQGERRAKNLLPFLA